MAILRNVIFAVLFAISFSIHAETINATSTPGVSEPALSRIGQFWPQTSAGHAAGCSSWAASATPGSNWNSCFYNGTNYFGILYTGYACFPQAIAVPVGGCPAVYTCPSGGNWTLSGTQCTRPDCVSPQVRQSDGTCAPPACVAGDVVQSASYFGGWRVGTATNAVVGPNGQSYFEPPPTTICDGTCMVTMTTSGTCTSGVAPYVDTPQAIHCVGTGEKTGGTCTTSSDLEGSPPTIPNHRPKCSSDEGVLTSSSGTVACVPSSAPGSKPVVSSSKQVQNFPDGSTKTIETTYTKDPATGVQDTQQQITNTPATGGGAGQAGPTGTTTISDSVKPSGNGTDPEAADFCQKNSQLQICKGDMNKEETQIQVRDYIKSLTDPASTPYTALENAKHSDDSQSALQSELDKFTAGADGSVAPNSTSKSAWESAMSSGWFEPITRQGCTPYTATISGRTWTLDICPTAEKISVISEYVIWFLLVVGSFVLLTGGMSRSS